MSAARIQGDRNEFSTLGQLSGEISLRAVGAKPILARMSAGDFVSEMERGYSFQGDSILLGAALREGFRTQARRASASKFLTAAGFAM